MMFLGEATQMITTKAGVSIIPILEQQLKPWIKMISSYPAFLAWVSFQIHGYGEKQTMSCLGTQQFVLTYPPSRPVLEGESRYGCLET